MMRFKKWLSSCLSKSGGKTNNSNQTQGVNLHQSVDFMSSLKPSQERFTLQLTRLLLGKKVINSALLEAIKTQLLKADLGMEVTEFVIAKLTQTIERKHLSDPSALMDALQEILYEQLIPYEQHLIIKPEVRPYVVVFVGINGVGKTTTLGKLAKQLQQAGHKVLLAAGDTFRAAAVEQLQVWGVRNHVDVIAQPRVKADSASVIFDAISAAKARKIDVVLADTAGRLHNKEHLMRQLQKIKRVIAKHDATAPHDVLLVLDASLGQNSLSQAEQFMQAIGVTGLVLTKLDGTAKGGAVFAVAHRLKIPIYYLGVGEGIDDLKPFKARAFVQALFGVHTT